MADLRILIEDKRTKAEEYYENQHTIKLSQSTSIDSEKELERKLLLCTYEDNFQLSLLEQFVRINSWRDVETLTNLPFAYMSMRVENDRNESLVDPMWHSEFCHSLCQLLSWCLHPLYQKLSNSQKPNSKDSK